MARYGAGCTTTAGTTARPIMSLYAAANTGCRLVEVGIFNTTTTAVELKLVRLTNTTGQGTALTEGNHDPGSASASACQCFNTHGADTGLGTDLGYRATIGAAAGAGVVWTFGGESGGLVIAAGTSNGIGVIPTGTGQICSAYFIWSE